MFISPSRETHSPILPFFPYFLNEAICLRPPKSPKNHPVSLTRRPEFFLSTFPSFPLPPQVTVLLEESLSLHRPFQPPPPSFLRSMCPGGRWFFIAVFNSELPPRPLFYLVSVPFNLFFCLLRTAPGTFTCLGSRRTSSIPNCFPPDPIFFAKCTNSFSSVCLPKML